MEYLFLKQQTAFWINRRRKEVALKKGISCVFSRLTSVHHNLGWTWLVLGSGFVWVNERGTRRAQEKRDLGKKVTPRPIYLAFFPLARAGSPEQTERLKQVRLCLVKATEVVVASY